MPRRGSEHQSRLLALSPPSSSPAAGKRRHSQLNEHSDFDEEDEGWGPRKRLRAAAEGAGHGADDGLGASNALGLWLERADDERDELMSVGHVPLEDDEELDELETGELMDDAQLNKMEDDNKLGDIAESESDWEDGRAWDSDSEVVFMEWGSPAPRPSPWPRRSLSPPVNASSSSGHGSVPGPLPEWTGDWVRRPTTVRSQAPTPFSRWSQGAGSASASEREGPSGLVMVGGASDGAGSGSGAPSVWDEESLEDADEPGPRGIRNGQRAQVLGTGGRAADLLWHGFDDGWRGDEGSVAVRACQRGVDEYSHDEEEPSEEDGDARENSENKENVPPTPHQPAIDDIEATEGEIVVKQEVRTSSPPPPPFTPPETPEGGHVHDDDVDPDDVDELGEGERAANFVPPPPPHDCHWSAAIDELVAQQMEILRLLREEREARALIEVEQRQQGALLRRIAGRLGLQSDEGLIDGHDSR